jgi:hypothetical protein
MTSLTKPDEISIIKTDEVGRRQTPSARRERLLDEFDRSGLSAARFAAVTGLKYSTFAAWVHRRRKQQNSATQVPVKAADPVRWLEAVVATAQTPGEPISAVVILQLPGGVRLEVADDRQVGLAAMLVRALAKSC